MIYSCITNHLKQHSFIYHCSLAELSWDHVSQLCLQPLVVQLVMDSLVHHSQSGALVKDPVMAWALDFFPHGVSFHLTDGLVHMAAVF